MEPAIVNPQHPVSPTALDGDFDEELHMQLHANVTPPPPPPPPPPRRQSGGSSRHERRIMMQQQQQQQQQHVP
eukprot:CAMPEP_0116142330 /NCGR_PEP_ID=MMETSP0329-20121206/14851_1 /TAXON_ID=697910 /ORGANISM="Pseudo-nitzschia arenysensis, Strain B593" /LENGTH=72 /DNA_ID=CAMNT_0003637559 /DNA_START=282 /DNA_END=496 /DNA_ORIENTATION=+